MLRFKSPLTEKKLKQSRSARNLVHDFNYSSYPEIDKAFQTFCKESKKDLFSDQIDCKTIEENDKKHFSKDYDCLDLKDVKMNYLKDRVVEFYKNQKKQNNLGIVSPVVKLFGNTVIASIFQSLIIKTIEDTFNLQIDDPMNFSHRFFFFLNSIIIKNFLEFLNILESLTLL